MAQRLLASASFAGVSVEESPDGELSDHYDGRQRVIRLADPESTSIAAIAVVAHEVGHAVQHAERSGAFRVRAALAPAASIASAGWLILATVAILLGFGLLHAAVLLFAMVVVFHIVTLPVEVQASRKALGMVRAGGLITPAEERLVRRVLTAPRSRTWPRR